MYATMPWSYVNNSKTFGWKFLSCTNSKIRKSDLSTTLTNSVIEKLVFTEILKNFGFIKGLSWLRYFYWRIMKNYLLKIHINR